MHSIPLLMLGIVTFIYILHWSNMVLLLFSNFRLLPQKMWTLLLCRLTYIVRLPLKNLMAPVAMLQFIKVRRSQNNTDHFLVSIYKLLLLCSFLSGIDLFSLGQPYLWARLDRRPNKQTEKRFKKYQHSHKSCKGRLTLSKTVPPRFLNMFSFW